MTRCPAVRRVAKRTFKVVRPGFPASIEGKDYCIDIYNCKQEKNEVTFVFVLPENVSRRRCLC